MNESVSLFSKLLNHDRTLDVFFHWLIWVLWMMVELIFVKDVLTDDTYIRLGRIDKAARRVVVECGFVVFQGDKCLYVYRDYVFRFFRSRVLNTLK